MIVLYHLPSLVPGCWCKMGLSTILSVMLNQLLPFLSFRCNFIYVNQSIPLLYAPTLLSKSNFIIICRFNFNYYKTSCVSDKSVWLCAIRHPTCARAVSSHVSELLIKFSLFCWLYRDFSYLWNRNVWKWWVIKWGLILKKPVFGPVIYFKTFLSLKSTEVQLRIANSRGRNESQEPCIWSVCFSDLD